MPRKKNQQKAELPATFKGEPFYGLELDEEQIALADSIINPDIDIIFVNAKAGTGKTTIATGAAILLIKSGFYKDLIYIMAPYGEKKQGWLPGTITEKSSVYFEAFYQALVKCHVNLNTAIKSTSLSEEGTQDNGGFITCITDTYLRGSNLEDAVVIIDEAQNYTVQQLQKTLTRVGSKTKVIVIGHDGQCDLEDPRQSGFGRYIRHFSSRERVAICPLSTNHRSWISDWADQIYLTTEIKTTIEKLPYAPTPCIIAL